METMDGPAQAKDLLPCYALRVKPRHEKSVAHALKDKGYDEFLPLYEVRRRWVHRNSQTVRRMRLPLFPNYVFCRFDPDHPLPVLKTPGVLRLVSFAKVPVPLDETEVMSLKRIVESGLPAAPHPSLHTGSRIRVCRGPLSGLTGLLVRTNGQNRLVVSVTLLQRAVSVAVEPDWVIAASQPPNPRVGETVSLSSP